MEHTDYARVLRAAAGLGAAGLTALRVVTLRTAFDEDGLLPRGSHVLTLTVLAAVCVFGVLWFLSSRLNKLPGTEDSFAFRRSWMVPKLVAAELLFLGGPLTLLDGQTTLTPAAILLAVAEFGMVIPFVWTALASNREPFFFWVRLAPALFAGASMILRFQSWSHDPLVIHVVPSLLAWVCCMMEMMLLTGFSLNVGHRRSTVLFGLAAGVFACMAVPDYFLSRRITLPDLLTLLALGLWSVTYALELLRYRVQSEQPKPAPKPGESALPFVPEIAGLQAPPNEPPEAESPEEPEDEEAEDAERTESAPEDEASAAE